MANPKPVSQRIPRLLRGLAYVGTVLMFLWICVPFYLPGKGFTYLIMFGEIESPRYLDALKAINHYELPESSGYDAQFYAQLAMRPQLGDPELKRAIDSLPYRARRILFCWTAYGLALGDPVRALHIYSVQNIFCWLALAGVLLRWFPPVNWGNFFRWFGVLFSFGLCFSVRGSLVDGPSLLLLAIGVALAEMGRPWWSALILGVAGLGKETNILGGAALAQPRENTWSGWIATALRGALVLLPLFVWLIALKLWLGSGGDVGYRNFAAPFEAFVKKWQETLTQLGNEGTGSVAKWSMLMLIALTAQFLFFVLRPRWNDPWWRVGAAYSVLMIFIGDAVWEGYPGAASRVLLPMTLAFNVLVPRGYVWWIVLLFGNLTVFSTPETLSAPGRESYTVEGPRALRIVPGSGQVVEAVFSDKAWYASERSRFEYWRWSRSGADVTLRNPHPFALVADVSFSLRSTDDRSVRLLQGETLLWEGKLAAGKLAEVAIREVMLPPGDTLWRFETPEAPVRADKEDSRPVTFSLRNLTIKIQVQSSSPAPSP